METIHISEQEKTDNEWTFLVRVGEENTTQHIVTVVKEYWKSLTDEKEMPEDLVRRSFEFLLARESKESILKTFSLEKIQEYFPEFEQEVRL